MLNLCINLHQGYLKEGVSFFVFYETKLVTVSLTKLKSGEIKLDQPLVS